MPFMQQMFSEIHRLTSALTILIQTEGVADNIDLRNM